ncbi:MAG: hypothetical protein ACRD3W_29415 [Terriglobales bacterium]
MVTIYTERGLATEVVTERRQFSFAKCASIACGTALLLSLIACYNLNKDVKDLTHNKLPYIQMRLSMLQPGSLR